MKYKALLALRLLIGLVAVAVSNGQTGGLGLVFQQIDAIGPRQWLNLMAGAIASNSQVSQRMRQGQTVFQREHFGVPGRRRLIAADQVHIESAWAPTLSANPIGRLFHLLGPA